MKSYVSDEALQAFVDGELDVVESEALIARMRDDKDLAHRVCALRSLQSMVRLAYAEPPAQKGRVMQASTRRQFVQRCAYGCLVLLVGLSGGWALRGLDAQFTVSGPAIADGAYQTVSLARESDPNRVMLHIDSASPDKMRAVLDQAERYLDEADRQGRSMQIEVIANSHGLDLLREGVSPYSDRIASMRKRHASLYFVACSQSVARFKNEGQNVVLLPVAKTAPTAIGEIVTRLQQGWTYVRV